MELDFFEIEIDGRIHPVARHKLSPHEKLGGKSEFKISVWDSTIEAAKKVVSKFGVRHIITTTSDIQFLKEPEFKDIVSVRVHGEIKDLTPLEQLSKLEFLELLNNGKGKIDFSKLQRLKLLYCDFSKRYKNISALSNLENLYLRKYSKNNLEDLKNLSNLKELHLLFSKCKSLQGIDYLDKLNKVILDGCKELRTLDGLDENKSLSEVIIVDCRNLIDFKSVKKVSNNCLFLVDGEKIENRPIVNEDKIAILSSKLKDIGTKKETIKAIQFELKKLKTNISKQSWRNELKNCILTLNKLSNEIYTEEREEIITTIEYLFIDYDLDEIEKIIDDYREW